MKHRTIKNGGTRDPAQQEKDNTMQKQQDKPICTTLATIIHKNKQPRAIAAANKPPTM